MDLFYHVLLIFSCLLQSAPQKFVKSMINFPVHFPHYDFLLLVLTFQILDAGLTAILKLLQFDQTDPKLSRQLIYVWCLFLGWVKRHFSAFAEQNMDCIIIKPEGKKPKELTWDPNELNCFEQVVFRRFHKENCPTIWQPWFKKNIRISKISSDIILTNVFIIF